MGINHLFFYHIPGTSNINMLGIFLETKYTACTYIKLIKLLWNTEKVQYSIEIFTSFWKPSKAQFYYKPVANNTLLFSVVVTTFNQFGETQDIYFSSSMPRSHWYPKSCQCHNCIRQFLSLHRSFSSETVVRQGDFWLKSLTICDAYYRLLVKPAILYLHNSQRFVFAAIFLRILFQLSF